MYFRHHHDIYLSIKIDACFKPPFRPCYSLYFWCFQQRNVKTLGSWIFLRSIKCCDNLSFFLLVYHESTNVGCRRSLNWHHLSTRFGSIHLTNYNYVFLGMKSLILNFSNWHAKFPEFWVEHFSFFTRKARCILCKYSLQADEICELYAPHSSSYIISNFSTYNSSIIIETCVLIA